MKLLYPSRRFSWIWIVPVLALWFGLLIGNRPYATPDEGRYVEIPREMVASGNYITPRLNGVKYFEKPPLFYWIQAANLKLFGLGEWSMRLGCVLFGILGCIGTFLFTRKFFGATAGLAACFILATSPLYYALSRLLILDMPMTALLSISLFCFLVTIHTPQSMLRRYWAWGFYAFSALAVMTKGIMALAISGPVILIWALWRGRWKDLWPAYIPSGTVVFLLIAAPWHILASLQNPDFAYKYFIVEHFLRYTTSVHMRTQPFYFFAPVLLLGLFPWITLLWNAVKVNLSNSFSQKQKDISVFLLIWAGWTFGFFSISNSKLVPYILPSFVPLVILLGTYWDKLFQPKYHDSARQSLKLFIYSCLLLGMGGILTLWMFPQLLDHQPQLWLDFTILAGAILTASLVSLLFLYQGKIKQTAAFIPTVAIILISAVIYLMPMLQRPSIKPLAEIIQSLKQSGDIVGCYRTYYQDLPVYTNQIVTVVDIKGELEFGCDAEDCSAWMINEETFLQQWHSPKRMFIVLQRTHLNNLMERRPDFRYISLGQEQKSALISNR